MGLTVELLRADERRQKLSGVGVGIPRNLPETEAGLLTGTRRDGLLFSAIEMRMLPMIVQGASNGDIGRELNISLHTVKTHLQRICRRLDVAGRNSRVGLVVWCYRHGVFGRFSPEDIKDPDSPVYDYVLRLGPRQLECLRLVADGFSRREIAHKMGVGDSTVKTMLQEISTRNGLFGIEQMLTRGFQSRLIPMTATNVRITTTLDTKLSLNTNIARSVKDVWAWNEGTPPTPREVESRAFPRNY